MSSGRCYWKVLLPKTLALNQVSHKYYSNWAAGGVSMPWGFHVTADLNVNPIWASRNLQCDIHVSSKHCREASAFTSWGSPRASPSIFSIFLMMATFWWARKGYSILLGVGAPWSKYSVCYNNWQLYQESYRQWLNILCTRSLQWWSRRRSTVTQCDATWRERIDMIRPWMQPAG